MGIGKAASHRDTVVVLGTGVGDKHIEEGVRVCLETLTDLLPELCASERLVCYHEVRGHRDDSLDLCSLSLNALLAAVACSSACRVAPPPCLPPGGVYPESGG
jgi:hypothetical protein